uniref:Uncharacterized protein n=1 Tax=Chlamydomonas euryale TaxID=1486919 RepID=A0A7R9V3K5_9CHLO
MHGAGLSFEGGPAPLWWAPAQVWPEHVTPHLEAGALLGRQGMPAMQFGRAAVAGLLLWRRARCRGGKGVAAVVGGNAAGRYVAAAPGRQLASPAPAGYDAVQLRVRFQRVTLTPC